MLDLKDEKRVEVMEAVALYGVTGASKKLNIKEASIERYLRDIKEKNDKGVKAAPKILIFDIETSPMTVFVWGLYKQRIAHTNVIDDWTIISWSAKWINAPDIMSDVRTPEEMKSKDDSRVVKTLWMLFDEADIIVAHNGDSFDIRKMNARFIYHNIAPPSPYVTIDTLKQSRKIAAFSSHRLDYLNKFLNNKGKIKTDFDLWVRCVKGDKDALTEMVTYNEQDVVLLEEVYFELRPWMRSHPNLSVYEGKENVCHRCGSEDIVYAGRYATPAGIYDSYRCLSCGGFSKSSVNNISHEDRKNILRSIAR